jgi:hypothetical protein
LPKPTIVVFLGPTAKVADARACLEAEYLPPAEQGDIIHALRAFPVKAAVLIDGVIATAPAVRHKEILWSMHKGVRIYGAASMGALRAAELHDFGMEGHGFIYRWYRATPLADDEEVAVAMAPRELGAHALSDALIDMRLTLRRAKRLAIISPYLHDQIINAARQLHFVKRTYRNTIDRAKHQLPNSEKAQLPQLKRWLAKNAYSQKRSDALGLLNWIRSQNISQVQPGHAPNFHMTEAWELDLKAAGLLNYLND